MGNDAFQETIRKILNDYDEAIRLNENEIKSLIDAYNLKMKNEPVLERIKSGSVLVVGDIHGDFNIMKKVVNIYLKEKKADHLVFLGDIVDRGSNSIACTNLLFTLLLQYPNRIHIVRGNHESLSVNIRYGFLHEVKKFYGIENQFFDFPDTDSLPELFVLFNKAFANMPLALIHEKLRYFFVHGGIPKDMISLEEITNLPKGDITLANPIIMQLLWNDPNEEVEDYSYNLRGDMIYTYGSKLVDNFLKYNNLQMIIRAHQIFPDGFQYLFGKKLLSLFTSEEFYQNIQSKIALLNENGEIQIFSPKNQI
ncbi:MAG: hypothetical protein FK731_10180 [Asgard group archaeon]|nr:hypothetical protein [Asgard group archaeon]